MSDRMMELMELARGGDEDVALLVQSEIALQPDTRETLIEQAASQADEYAEQFAPEQQAVPDDVLEKMAEEAGF